MTYLYNLQSVMKDRFMISRLEGNRLRGSLSCSSPSLSKTNIPSCMFSELLFYSVVPKEYGIFLQDHKLFSSGKLKRKKISLLVSKHHKNSLPGIHQKKQKIKIKLAFCLQFTERECLEWIKKMIGMIWQLDRCTCSHPHLASYQQSS